MLIIFYDWQLFIQVCSFVRLLVRSLHSPSIASYFEQMMMMAMATNVAEPSSSVFVASIFRACVCCPDLLIGFMVVQAIQPFVRIPSQ